MTENNNGEFFSKWETEVMEVKKVDGIFVTSPANMRKCSGFRGEGVIYLSRELHLVFTDSRYTEAARAECPAFEVIQIKNNIYECCVEEILKRVGKEKASGLSVGFEDEHVTVKVGRTLQALWSKYVQEEIHLVPLHRALDRMRQIKSEDEIRDIERAEQIGDGAFAKIIRKLAEMRQERSFLTEQQVAAWLEFFMREQGAENTSFDTIAAGGIHSSMPHAIPTGRVLRDGDFLTMDFGCKVNGYCSDMTRTVMIGHADERQRHVYDIVLRAQTAALEAVRPGRKGCEVDAVARQIIADAGYGDNFGHGLGHSVGLMIHETPCFSPREESVLEPGIYIEGAFGVRIEDLIVVTEDGFRNLTHSPKELIEL